MFHNDWERNSFNMVSLSYLYYGILKLFSFLKLQLNCIIWNNLWLIEVHLLRFFNLKVFLSTKELEFWQLIVSSISYFYIDVNLHQFVELLLYILFFSVNCNSVNATKPKFMKIICTKTQYVWAKASWYFKQSIIVI